MDDEQRQHYEELLSIRQQRLRALERQSAAFGLETPAHVQIEIDTLQKEIINLQTKIGIKIAVEQSIPEDRQSRTDSGLSDIVYRGAKGNYVLIDQRPWALGRASVIWIASDQNNNTVCIKSFRQFKNQYNNPSEFIREIAARLTLDHSNILPIIDYGYETDLQNNSEPFLVLPFCKAGSLRNLLSNRDFIGIKLFTPILHQISTAIHFAHKNGIIHGDIKPENILFPSDISHVYLSDFGASRFSPVLVDVSTELPGAGSTTYLSPEQIEDNRQTPLSDIYSLAVVAYEALTGKLPFNINISAFQQMKLKIEGRIIDPWEWNRNLSSTTRKALLAGLNVNPQNRPSSATEFWKLLTEQLNISCSQCGRINRESARFCGSCGTSLKNIEHI